MAMDVLSIEEFLSSLQTTTSLPATQDYICILQKCKEEKKLAHAQRVYLHMCNNGLEGRTVLDNYLVPVFVDCGSTSDAQRIFNRSVVLNEHAWTSLIQGYVEGGKAQHALSLYQKMQADGVHPNRYTFVALLRACAKLRWGEKGQELRSELSDMGFEEDSYVASMLVSMYAKCGLLAESREVFEKLAFRDVVSWNAMITGYAEHGVGNEALNFIDDMQEGGVSPDAVTYLCTLKICASTGAFNRGREVHMEVITKGLENDFLLSNVLVDMYAKCGSFADALQLFDKLSARDAISWTSLIASYAEHGHGVEALGMLERMQLTGLAPDGVAFACSLKGCVVIGALGSGQEIHAEITKRGLEKDVFVGNSLADMYVKFSLTAEVRQIIDMLPARDVVSWNTLIAGYVEHELDEQALLCLEQMRIEGTVLDSVTCVCTLKACGGVRALDKGREIHAEVIKKGYERDCFIACALVDMYGKCGSLSESEKVFEMLPARDVVSWNALIAGYSELGLWDEALDCLETMQREGPSLDAVTLVCGLKACGSTGATHKGQDLHGEILKKGLEKDTFVGNTLVDMYANFGLLADARKVLVNLQDQNVVTWNAMITGCANAGSYEEVLECLEWMQQEGVCPDVVTFVSCLRACSCERTLNKGWEIYTQAAIKGFEDDPQVGSTLVCMFADCGFLRESQKVFDMLLNRDAVSWTSLIAGYAEHGFDEKAIDSLEHMQLEGISPDDVTLTSILRICAKIGAVHLGREIYSDIIMKGFEREPFICFLMVDLLAKDGLFEEAWKVLNELSVTDALSWTAILVAYAQQGQGEQALEIIDEMQVKVVPLDALTFGYCLRACGSIRAVAKGRDMHMDIVKKGLESGTFLGNALVDMYAKCGFLKEAWEVLTMTSVEDVASWNTLMTGFTDHDLCVEALDCFEQMNVYGVIPNSATYISALKACGNIEAGVRGQEIHCQIVTLGIDKQAVSDSVLVEMYARCGLFADARKVFAELPVQDVNSCIALIKGYTEYGFGEEALQYRQELNLDGDISSNAAAYVCSLKACRSIGALEEGRRIHAEIVKRGCDLNSYIGNTLIDMYSKCGSFKEARRVFNGLLVQDVISWTALIAGYDEHGYVAEALKCLKEMQQQGVTPTAVTFICGLKACDNVQYRKNGQELHISLTNCGYEQDSTVGNALVNMYAKCGLLAEAQDVFDKLQIRDVVLWNVLIGGYADQKFIEVACHCFQQMQVDGVMPDATLWNTLINGFGDERESNNAFVSFCQMQEQGLLPDSMIFLSILKACGNASALERGKRCHTQIQGNGDSELEAVGEILYTALIDMYGKCGNMVDGQHIFDTMDKRREVTWNALITGYARRGESDYACHLVKRMLEEVIKPDSITFLSVLNACSHGGMVDEGKKYFKGMSRVYGMAPTIKHHSCVLDLLGRAGQLDEVVGMMEKLPLQPDLQAWNSILSSCQKWGKTEFGRQAFERAVTLEGKDVASFILMSNMFAGEDTQDMEVFVA